MTGPVRVAVVGCGWWATEAHLPALVAHPDAEPAAVVDPDPKRRRIAAERFGVRRTFGDIEELLHSVELDGAVVATPPSAHSTVAARLIESGLHTLIEKPMTVEPSDAHDLVALAARHSVKLLVSYPWNYNAHALTVREALASQRVGTIELISCLFGSVARELYRGRPELYADVLGYTHATPNATTYSDRRAGGQALTQLTHALALLLWLTGLEPIEVVAFTENFELEVDLVDAASIRFSTGRLASVATAGNVIPGHVELLEYRFLGTDGYVLLDLGAGTGAIHDGAGIEQLPQLSLSDRYPLAAPANNLVALAQGIPGNFAPGALGATVVDVLDGIRRSQAERRVVELS
jgi:predicted dehydrogenase